MKRKTMEFIAFMITTAILMIAIAFAVNSVYPAYPA